MDDLAEYINSLDMHPAIRNWLYRVERTSKAKTPALFMRDLIYSVGAFILSNAKYDDQPSAQAIANVIEVVAEFLEVNIGSYNLTDLWGYR